MGLDMYLTGKKYLSSHQEKEAEQAKKVREIFPELKNFSSGNMEYTEVCIEAAYWRKANAIHQWFVNVLQDREDDCQEYLAPRTDLEILLKKCEKIKSSAIMKKGKIKNGTKWENGKPVEIEENGEYVINPEICEEILPSTSGFFFGSTDYDQYYMQDIDYTVSQLKKCLSLPSDWDFYYRASW